MFSRVARINIKWAWLSKYCTAIRTAQSFIQNTPLPKDFALDVREKLSEIVPPGESLCLDYENNDMFSKAEDEQLLIWLNRFVQVIFDVSMVTLLSYTMKNL